MSDPNPDWNTQDGPSNGSQERDSPEAQMARDYIVALRSHSAARFRPDEGQEFLVRNVLGIQGPLRLRLRTRWVDEGFEALVPRELWVEAAGLSKSLDVACSAAASTAQFLAAILAFCTNTTVDIPEVHLAYDASPECSEREFLEVYVPDEKGIPREGRAVSPKELTALYGALGSSNEPERITRALYQYAIALRYWYFGGEWLALAHLYMAVEALTVAVVRRECEDRGVDETRLAPIYGVDPADPNRPRWRPALEAQCRLQAIFGGDRAVYETAKSASDGLEHGFMDLSQINRHAMEVTGATFSYVRRTILRLLNILSPEHQSLFDRTPLDVQSTRKMVRGHFVGDVVNPAPTGEEYPYLEWSSSLKTFSRSSDDFNVSLEEKFTVVCAPGVGFRGAGIEVRGRGRPGQDPILFHAVDEIRQDPGVGTSTRTALLLMSRANRFASAVAAPGRTQGMSPISSLTFGRFAEQIALFEGIQALLLVHRPVEAIILLEKLMIGTFRLQQIDDNRPNHAGIVVRTKHDALQRQLNVFSGDNEIITSIKVNMSKLQSSAAAQGITIADRIPNMRTASFYREHIKSFRFTKEVARVDDLAVALHTTTDNDGSTSIRTQTADSKLSVGVAGVAVQAITKSAVCLAQVTGWTYEENVADELYAEGRKLEEE